jgi:hypothetical protein
MKQIIIELPDAEHAALKKRAAASLRKIPQQLLFEALQHASAAGFPTAPRKVRRNPPAPPRVRIGKEEPA